MLPTSSHKSPQTAPVGYHKDGAQALTKILSPFQQSTKRQINTAALGQSCLVKYALNHTTLKLETCACPHVLVADDDNFQHFYYQSLFHKSLDFTEVSISKEKLRIDFCFSGEELNEKYSVIKKCGCNNLVMIITDYHMGELKLNGIATAAKVRDAGYKGSLLLRTSETQEFLKAKHGDIGRLIEDKTVDGIIDKGNVKVGKDTIQQFLVFATKVFKH